MDMQQIVVSSAFKHRLRTMVHHCERVLYGLWRVTLGRPAGKAAMILAGTALLCAFFLHSYECSAAHGDSPYCTIGGTLKQVVVLLFSGFDVEKTPDSRPGWFFAIVTLLLGIALMALVTADLASYLVRAALRINSNVRYSFNDHFVICGWGERDKYMLRSLTSDVRRRLRQVVVVDERLERDPSCDPFVHSVRGDPTEEEVLRRAHVSGAHTALIPTDWTLTDRALRDARSTLSMLAVEACNPHTYTCVEVCSPESKRHLGRTAADEIICAGELSRRVLTQAALNHGLSDFLLDLLALDRTPKIRKEALPPAFAGMTFRELFVLMNEALAEVLLAVERMPGPAKAEEAAQPSGGGRHPQIVRPKIFTNPRGEFRLQPGDQLFILGPGSIKGLRRLAQLQVRDA